MARRPNPALWDEWRQRLKRQGESGLSIAAFCRREELAPQAFHAWKRRLSATRGSRAVRPGRQPGGVTAGQQGPASFASSPSPADFLQLPLARTPQSPWMELALPDGTVVRVPQENIPAMLAVLRVLRGDSREMRLAGQDHA